jgi:glucose 1-dehydrogenase
MTGILAGKVAVITGGTRGIGLAIAGTYTQHGARVVISSRSPESVEQALEQLNMPKDQVIGLPCDVRDLEQVQSLAGSASGRFGRIDIWVNNAGVSGPYGPTLEISPERFVEVVQTNIMGVYHGSMVAAHHFTTNGSGKLINVVGRGARGPVPYQNAYASSKAWIKSFTMALAKEIEGREIGVYVLSPGMVLTDMLERPEVVRGYEEKLGTRYQLVLRMWSGPADEAAAAALWLASPATDGKTGIDRRLLTGPKLAAGALRELGRRLLGRPIRTIDVSPEIVPPWTPGSIGRS